MLEQKYSCPVCGKKHGNPASKNSYTHINSRMHQAALKKLDEMERIPMTIDIRSNDNYNQYILENSENDEHEIDIEQIVSEMPELLQQNDMDTTKLMDIEPDISDEPNGYKNIRDNTKINSTELDIDKVDMIEYKENTFFEGLKAWAPIDEKKTLFQRILRRKKKRTETKLCVFVADGEDPVCKELPVDPNSQLISNPDTGEVYLKPLRGNIYFFDKYKCLPLVDCPKVDAQYDLPEHLALKFYNLGFGEAELSGYKALIEKINKWQLQVTLCMGVTLITVLACAYMFKTNMDQIEMMQSTVNILAELYGK